ncbi:DUF2577 domain-containing protein, partial [bacterium]|nr:DUF2577 domain-containing protein [bacterium]
AFVASKPSEIYEGVVISESPLKINVEQKFTLNAAQLVLTRNVTDFYDDITVIAWRTENESGGGGDAAFASHSHALVGRKHIIVHNRLLTGDKVILIRQQGGQKYIVIDRVGDFNGSSTSLGA